MAPAPESTPTFNLIPIPGMDRVRKNFENINGGQCKISQTFQEMEHVPLSLRFGLAERGYIAVRETPANQNASRQVFIGNVTSRDGM